MPRKVFTFGSTTAAPIVTHVSEIDRKEIEQRLEPVPTSEILDSLVVTKDEQKEVALKPEVKSPKPILNPKVTRPKPIVQAQAVPQAQAQPQKDYSKYGKMEKYAIQKDINESGNPYKDKNAHIFPLQTRLSFQTKINEMYVNTDFMKKGEEKQLDFDACKKIGAGDQAKVEMYEYQKFVRDYMRQASPYRGILVYHGLGSGKTCSAIAAAEALFSVSKKRIIVMTPFSLRDNFIREVSFCGFKHFRVENHWIEFETSDPIVRVFAKEILGLNNEYLSKNSKIWIPEFEGSPPANFKDKTPQQKEQIRRQLVGQITSRIQFVNYNGISASKLKRIACKIPEKDGSLINFDDSVIIVDEIHNLTRLMQGTIEPYLSTLPSYHVRRKIAVETITPDTWKPALCGKDQNYKRGYLLYRLLTGAKNSKIIGLSGTPLINFPEEISILMNLLSGYIHMVTMQITPGSESHKETIKLYLEEHPYTDFIDVKNVSNYIQVSFTLIPEGMKKAAGGVERVDQDVITPTIYEVVKEFSERIANEGFTITKDSVKYESIPLLPPVGEDFQKYFLDKTDPTKLINHIVLRKRIQGLISYYKGSKKELMPLVTKDELVRVPFSQHSMKVYCTIRSEELNVQMNMAKQSGAAGQAVGGKMAALWAELYDLTLSKSANSYRMSSRQASNFAFPDDIVRPRPGSEKDLLEVELGKESDEIYGDVSQEELLEKDTDEDVEEAEKEDDAIDKDAEDAMVADLIAKGDVEGAEKLKESLVLPVLKEKEAPKEVVPPMTGASAALAAKAFRKSECEVGAFQDNVFFPNVDSDKTDEGIDTLRKKVLTVASARVVTFHKELNKKQEIEVRIVGLTDLNSITVKGFIKEVFPGSVFKAKEYTQATKESKRCLREFADRRLRLYARKANSSIVQEFEQGAPTNPEGLEKYSPKYAEILKRILSCQGSNLVYSQFLEMEGIGIFQEVMDINEFERIEITEDGKSFTPATIDKLTQKEGAPDVKSVKRYLSFTGSEKREKRSSALRVFNAKYNPENPEGSRFYELSGEMSVVLEKAGYSGNLKGELCNVFCITSAGAEGLSLRNVRRVHIMEPYWNNVRTDQVKGRAVRICSHIDLDYNADENLNQRTVEVYTYCAVFSPDVLRNPGDAIPETVRKGDEVTAKEASDLGIDVPHGVKQYIITSDEHLYTLSERKKKVLFAIQNLMKRSAVDCLVNQAENEEEGVDCINLDGTHSQYAYHPNLEMDIALTNTEFGKLEEKQEVLDQVDELDEHRPRPLEVTDIKPVREFEAIIIRNKKRGELLAVPKFEKGSTIPIRYDLHNKGQLPTADNKIGSSSVVQDGDMIGLPTKPFIFSD